MNVTTERVVVGYDASEESTNAVRWAASAAQRRKTPLLVVSATGWAEPPAGMSGSLDAAKHFATRMAEDGERIASEVAPSIATGALGVQGTAVEALTINSHGAALVVLGHRGRGARKAAGVGSVAFAVAQAVTCPTAIIRGTVRPLPTSDFPSVVGVDGSEHSDVALDRAAVWAAESSSLLRIVVAWKAPFVQPWSSFTVGEDDHMELEATGKAKRAAQGIADRAEERVRGAHPDLHVETVVQRGRPAEVIIEAARDASLIIVGARGRGDVASFLLGSVSREVMELADCAVYVVR